MSPLDIGLAALLALAALALLLRRRSSYAAHLAQLGGAAQQPKRALVVGTWTRAEVAQHASADDLWLIMREEGSGRLRVYDLTDYVAEHPGGEAILTNAGGDASEGFHGPQHPPTVHELVKDYCIGDLADP